MKLFKMVKDKLVSTRIDFKLKYQTTNSHVKRKKIPSELFTDQYLKL